MHIYCSIHNNKHENNSNIHQKTKNAVHLYNGILYGHEKNDRGMNSKLIMLSKKNYGRTYAESNIYMKCPI